MSPAEREDVAAQAIVESIHDNNKIETSQLRPQPVSQQSASSPRANDSPVQTDPQLLIKMQPHAPWNLNRLSHAALPVGSNYNYTSDGTGVNVYVVDTVT